MKQGNGDASLVLFGEKVTPNLHKIAGEYVLLDNFYENSDVSADGHNWATAAIAPDWTQRFWPNSYAGRRKLTIMRVRNGEFAARRVHLECGRAGRRDHANYGYYVDNREKPEADGTQITGIRDPILAPLPIRISGASIWITRMSTARKSSLTN